MRYLPVSIRSIPHRVRARGPTWAALLVVGVAYAIAHKSNIDHPRAIGEGWWRWWDQGHYFRAAHAWAQGDLSPETHWYFPGYALIGALFCWAKPAQPFWLPNLVALLVFGWLFVRLAERLSPRPAEVRTVAPLVFVLTVAVSPWMMKSFVEPWTTTPTAPLTLASLLLAFRFADTPTPRNAFLLGAASVSVVLFRPTEAMVLTGVVAIWAVCVLAARHEAWRATVRVAASGVCGALLPAIALAGLHYAVYGWTISGYMAQSRAIGFEWTLVPLRWVTLFIAPQPLFTDSVTYAMAGAFPWLVPGVAGMVATVMATAGVVRLRNVLVALLIVVHCFVYLAYRDLHPQGLLRYNNYHYFKWLLPVLGLYCVFLVSSVRAQPRRWAIWAVATGVVVTLFCWRAEWKPLPGAAARVIGPRSLVVPSGLPSPRLGLRAKASGSFIARFMDNHTMVVGGRTYVSHADFSVFPVPEGVLVAPLRPIPAEESTIMFNVGVVLDESASPELGQQAIVFGWPTLIEQAYQRPRAWLQRAF